MVDDLLQRVFGAAHQPLQRRRIGSLADTRLKPPDLAGQLRDQAFGAGGLGAPARRLARVLRSATR
ncbi:hypothetical protein [Streptomyces sp. NPDC002994]|uniref:hypothetical protein n=1 Tax=Streptomyces sp. NPDC002994 TaxID=3154441 RepID=UPI0033A512D2